MAREEVSGQSRHEQPGGVAEQAIRGHLHNDAGEPLEGAVVTLCADNPAIERGVGKAKKTDKSGAFEILVRTARDCTCELGVAVADREGRTLVNPEETRVHVGGAPIDLDLTVPPHLLPTGKRERPSVELGPFRADARTVAEAEPELALDVARVLIGEKVTSEARRRVELLFPAALGERRVEPLCYTSVLEGLDALIAHKGWSREVGLSCDSILRMDHSAFETTTHSCPNFTITYETTQVDPDTSAATVFDPGSNPPVAIGSLPAGGAPTYIKRVCFWLERALAAYTSPPFSMLNPAAGGPIPVVINTAPYGSASSSGVFYLNNQLSPDLLCAVAVHELFHMVQYAYGGSGAWRQSLFEGGAVFAEDTAADLMNRYLDEASTNFNGAGVMSNPNLSLESASYKCSLFWRYVAEQQSGDVTEPFVGVETYRRVIERCSAGSYSAADVKQALRELPWYQDFYEYGYLDSARLDRMSSETTLGNYALACRLKDLGAAVPDSRFDFLEDEENIYIDDVVHAAIPSAPLEDTLASVALAGSGTVSPANAPTWSTSVNRFAHRYFEVDVDPAVTNVQIGFSAGSGLTSRIFQVALIDSNGAVRDIHRTDAAAYSKRIANERDGVKLAKLVLVVTGADSSGTFTLSAAPAAPAPDVMVTRWHSRMRTEYEINSFGWAWTWVSPDIWVDNDMDGVADGQVFFDTDNKLHIRLHNKGNSAATGIGVELWYQDASTGLSDAAWLPVQDTGGATQILSGLDLPAGASEDWTVNWSPVPSGMSQHFCVRAVVSVPGDPNSDNKRVLSNFGNVVLPFRRFVDLDLLRRNILDAEIPITLRVIPRLASDVRVEPRDLKRLEKITVAPGDEAIETIRLAHRPLAEVFEHQHEDGPGAGTRRALRQTPDPRGHYPADEETLPPGLAGQPMITVVHEANGLPLGGVTYLVTVEGEGK
jgi:hypothetical protein